MLKLATIMPIDKGPHFGHGGIFCSVYEKLNFFLFYLKQRDVPAMVPHL